MTRHDDATRLRHMLDSAREALAMAQDRTRADLDSNRMLELALVRLVEIVGEAAVRVSEAQQSRLPMIPWQQVVGMRNRLVHGYAAIDRNVLWDTIHDDLPPLIEKLQAALETPEN